MTLVFWMTSYWMTSGKIYEWMWQSNDDIGTFIHVNECVNSYATIKIKCIHKRKHYHFFKKIICKKKKLSLVRMEFQVSRRDCFCSTSARASVLRKQSPLETGKSQLTCYWWNILIIWPRPKWTQYKSSPNVPFFLSSWY